MHRLILTILLILLGSAMLLAGTSGKVSGTVKDGQTGEPIIGATIIIEGTRLGAAADVNGFYTILNVPPGKVNVIASAVGYQRSEVKGVVIQVDLTSKIDFAMQNEAVNVKEQVVTAERPVIRKDLTSVESHVDADQIKNLPATEVHDVLTLQSGITTDQGGGIHIRGGRSSEVAYWVDGRPITDAYNNSQGVQVSNNSLQELQVVSGTFNAEYGNAMSGIINIVTKDGGSTFDGWLNAYAGSYVTPHTDIFYNLGKIKPISTRNLEASLSGPIPGVGDLLRFFTTGRYYYSDGYLYGLREFTTTRFFTDANRADSGQAVPMNPSKQFTGQGKLTVQIAPMVKLNLGAIGSMRDYRDYNHGYRLEPDGDVNQFERGFDLSAQFTHTVNSNMFYTVNASEGYHRYYQYLYQNPYDPRYITDFTRYPTTSYEFSYGGTNNNHFDRNTRTYDFKIDMTDQATPIHQLKFGAEMNFYQMYLDQYNVVSALDSNNQATFKPNVEGDSSINHAHYYRAPNAMSAYIQDKIEVQSVIINFGLRFDYFNPRGQVLADPSDPNIYNPVNDLHAYHDLNGDGIISDNEKQSPTTLAERQSYWYKSTTKKSQVSPRLGIAYPITDRGVIHFSYGHFLQIPSFSNLYDNPDFKVSYGSSGIQGPFGNPDLKPQKTVMYELGLQQQVTEDIGLDITGYYRDIRDWVTTSPVILTKVAGISYTTFINQDYANVRGVTLSVGKRLSDYYQYNLSYTYQIAEGVNSNPSDKFFALQNGTSPVEVLSPLAWDQTHTLNVTFGVGDNNTGAFVIGRYGSGLPYTPVQTTATLRGVNSSNVLPTNSRRIPASTTLDLRAFRNMALGGRTVTVSLQVFNLLDALNAVNVFGDTGLPDRTLTTANVADNAGRVNKVADYIKYPYFYSTPREVQLGIQLAF